MGHIIERLATHLFWDPGFILALSFLFGFLQRRFKKEWMGKWRDPRWAIVTAAIVLLIVVIFREIPDLQRGGTFTKSYVDIGGHIVIIVASCWVLFRLLKWGIEYNQKKKRN